MPEPATPPTTSAEVRARLVEALKLDLVGPGHGHPLAGERLPGHYRPSTWYLTGFLIPSDAPIEQRADDDAGDDMDTEIPGVGGLAEESSDERKAAKTGFFPSSIGVSCLVSAGTRSLSLTVRWGDYEKVTGGAGAGAGAETGSDVGTRRVAGADDEVATRTATGAATGTESATQVGAPETYWQRHPRSATLRAPLDGRAAPLDVPGSGGLYVHLFERPIDSTELDGQVPPGTRSVAIFLVNNRPPVPKEVGDPDGAHAFQAELEVTGDEPFVPRPDVRGSRAGDWDERVADLHYAATPEYATGHGVSAEWELDDGQCRLIRTAWIPSAEVEKTATAAVEGVLLSMEALGALADGDAARAALQPLVDGYRAWIEEQRARIDELPEARRETAEELLRRAGLAAHRIERGVHVLADDPDALDAFRVANRAVARALRRRMPERFTERPPEWHAFQLAFQLLNLPGLVDPSDPEHKIVDLLFFPTGGGKTEAYLGLAAFAMVLRRLRHPEDGGRAGAGVSVIMRYTLRLLTLDQLARAAGLMCALELERTAAGGLESGSGPDSGLGLGHGSRSGSGSGLGPSPGSGPERYGRWPFEIGLWVGKAATPNVMGKKGDALSDSARNKTRRFKADPRNKPSPIPLEECPWCGTRFTAESFALLPDDDAPAELRIVCANFECDFSGDRPLPIVAVDDSIYRRLPAFLIATLDKFAALPWVGPSGALLGGAERRDGRGFYSAAEPGLGTPLPAPLPPPDLVIQDELHLISGPLGTMAGLFETSIEALCRREVDGRVVLPKIVASTATVRQAQDQIQALFGRPETRVFPPPGPDRRDSFFARTLPPAEAPARLYLGVAVQGRNPKALMRKVLLALMGAAAQSYHAAGGDARPDNPADPYMTVLGYFNSLRELGGARRILEEEVQNTIKSYGERRRVDEERGLFRDRPRFSEVVELTSRVPTNKVADARRRLGLPYSDREQRVDCAIATNMISVGLDIARLGLMVVIGQPKAHAEYIQATSRVGRDDRRPGLVVTLLNLAKPRDRSHYERFRHYHATFYRAVEASSVTPFSARALDRGLAGALVALARHAEPELTPADGVERIGQVRVALERRLIERFLERIRQQPWTDAAEREERERSVRNRIVDLLDAWQAVIADYHAVGVPVQYQPYERKGPKPLLREMLESETAFETEQHRKFRANRSLRDVEPDVGLFLHDLTGRPVEEGA